MTRRSHAPDSSPGPSRPHGVEPPIDRTAARPAVPRALRLGVFGVLTLVIGGAAIFMVVTRLLGPSASDTAAIQVHASMGGFDPPALTVKVGQQVKIELSSMDTSMHSDGGGWHQFAIDALGIDWKVGPLSSDVFEFTAPATAGTYSWYCDICCGGKANPSMQGTLTVAA